MPHAVVVTRTTSSTYSRIAPGFSIAVFGFIACFAPIASTNLAFALGIYMPSSYDEPRCAKTYQSEGANVYPGIKVFKNTGLLFPCL